MKFGSKRLKRIYKDDDAQGLDPAQTLAIRDVLSALDAASSPSDLDLPGFGLHPLKGKWKGYWAVSAGQERIAFRFHDRVDVDLLDA